jgi:tripartite-type tricarboxylate transporter receptor subunit TctC
MNLETDTISQVNRYRRKMVGYWLSGCVAVCLGVCSAAAQTFPNRPLRIIVPFAAGGPNDVAARLVADALRPHLSQSVVVENRAGAGGLVGAEAVVNATPDGYTLLFGTVGPLVISPSAAALRYDPAKDLVPVGQVYRSAQVFSATPRLGKTRLANSCPMPRTIPARRRWERLETERCRT